MTAVWDLPDFDDHEGVHAFTDPESVERYRREAAADSASHAEYLRQYGPNGYRRNQYRHLSEQKRQEAVEAAGRAAVADLYE